MLMSEPPTGFDRWMVGWRRSRIWGTHELSALYFPQASKGCSTQVFRGAQHVGVSVSHFRVPGSVDLDGMSKLLANAG